MKQLVLTCLLATALAIPAEAHSKLTKDNVKNAISACNSGQSSKACLDLARAFRDKKKAKELGLKVDMKKSLAAAQRGCNMGNSYACGTLARVYADKRFRGRDKAKAHAAIDRACQLGNREVCSRRAEIVR